MYNMREIKEEDFEVVANLKLKFLKSHSEKRLMTSGVPLQEISQRRPT